MAKPATKKNAAVEVAAAPAPEARTGNIAQLKHNAQSGRWEVTYKGAMICSRVGSPGDDGAKNYCRAVITGGLSQKAKKFNIIDLIEVGADGQPAANVLLADGTAAPVTPIITIESEFPINERFEILENYVDMVSTGDMASAVITGPGGLGKSYTVMKVVKDHGLVNIGSWLERAEIGAKYEASTMSSFITVKGYSTAKGLYRTLYENKNQLIIFDDCDSVLRDPTAVNLLKAALDSYDERIVTWNSEGFVDDGLPRSFEFTGGVLFISNMAMHKIPQAIRSRAPCIDVSMTRSEVVDRMRVIVSSDHFLPEFDMDVKLDAMEFVADHAFHPLVQELNLRSLVNVVKTRQAKPDSWKRMALYDMASSSTN